MPQDIAVGLVFVDIAQADAQHVDQRIPPLKHLHKSEQHDVPRMESTDVTRLVEHYLTSSLLPILPADDDVTHPTEGSHVVRMAIDMYALLLLLPEGTTPQPYLQASHLPEPHHEQGYHTNYIYKG